MELLKLEKDCRRNIENKEILIMVPCGDKQQFLCFQERMQRLGIDQDSKIDFLFITTKEIDLNLDCMLSAIIYSEAKVKLGTSGAFFAGQVQSYNLKYKSIVIADLDAYLPSKDLLYKMIELSKKHKKVIQPLSKAKTTIGDAKGGVMNQWNVFPREIFIKYGFASGFLFKGAEDFDISVRMKKDILIYKEGLVYHKAPSPTLYHKFLDKAKSYPYLISLMRVYLFQRDYKAYLIWNSYHNFFADVFGDDQLRNALRNTVEIEKLNQDIINDNSYVKITQVNDQGVLPTKMTMMATMVKSLLFFMMNRPIFIYTDKIELQMSRLSLFVGLFKAVFMAPLRLAEGLMNILVFYELYNTGFVYPIRARKSDIDSTVRWMVKHFPKQEGSK